METFFTSAPTVDSMTPLEAKIGKAKVKVTATIVKHNVSLAFTEHLSPLFKEILPDSPIAQGFGSCKTKTSFVFSLSTINSLTHDSSIIFALQLLTASHKQFRGVLGGQSPPVLAFSSRVLGLVSQEYNVIVFSV